MPFLYFIELKSVMTINKRNEIKKYKKHNKAKENYGDIICIMKWQCNFLKFGNFKQCMINVILIKFCLNTDPGY